MVAVESKATHIDEEQEITRNREHVGLKDRVAQGSQRQREVVGSWLERDEGQNTKLYHVRWFPV